MKWKQRFSLLTRLNCLFLFLLATAAPSIVSAQSSQDLLRSSLVFQGTVTKTQATSMQVVTASPNTIVVKVEKVLHTTDQANTYVGKEITVFVKDPPSFKVGDKAVFYTQGWLLEEGIAVREINHTMLNAAGAMDSAVSENILTAIQTEDNKLLQQRISQASVVLEGEVVSTERLDILPAAAGGDGPPLQMVFSEHNPVLKKAVIKVSKVHQMGNISSLDLNEPQLQMITIIYPTSQDIAWIDSPRFEVGDAGLFFLQRAQTNLELNDFLKSVKGRIEGLEKSYVGFSPLDFHPKSDIERVKPLIKLSNP